MKPMYALHKDSSGSILAAGSFAYDFEFSKFLRDLDIRPGDSIAFGEATKRENEAPEPEPAFIADEPTPPPSAEPAIGADDQPF